ncbi:hydantoinase/oxoprolinase family protein [Rubrobacter calidifluminis]|uniref:hydantoinase/oxoprolinase family protein n=1 Tax=Rubrobacter calidifluminis TaxID=1392640 RepID=UPI002360472D|nr:hydantoinase/oxoprolinase family protein [Rubrobacter calidifluminis]
MRLGIDVGGTNTDAVILDSADRVLAKGKTPNSEDIVSSIEKVVSEVMQHSGVDPGQITHAMLGTTQVTNAIIERRGLARVGILRLGAPATRAIRPLAAWPQDLRTSIEGPAAILPGGVEYDGRPISVFDEAAVREAVRKMRGRVEAFAVSSVFSPVKSDDERRTAEIITEEVGEGIPVSISSEIGSIGLLERENATILNAAVTQVALRVVRAFENALRRLGIEAQLFLSQNDGTLMTIDYALRYPILTVACGPTNSIRGAAFLSGLDDAVVVDVGGTSTDVGVLSSGFPRESAIAVEIGGVQTNFRMPDLLSIGLGGGSIVRLVSDGPDDEVHVGPESVGYAITKKALCFGGDTLTMTDVAVSRGMAEIGDRRKIRVEQNVIEAAYCRAEEMFEEAIDRMKTSSRDVPVVAVGGGSILLPEKLPGVSKLHKPPHFEVANAVGAAIAQASGTIDRVFSLDNRSRDDVMDEARKTAFEEAVRAGADEESLEIVEVEEVPLAYLPGNAVRIKIKAAGRLKSYREDA